MAQNNRFKTSYSPFKSRHDAPSTLENPQTSKTDQEPPARPTPPPDTRPLPVLRPARNSSRNLFSIISKFEALDAVSLPPRIPALQPAPLQVSHNSSARRRGNTRATDQLRKLSTIFSPESKTPVSRDIRHETQENAYPGQDRNMSNEHENSETNSKSVAAKSSWRNRTKRSFSPRKSKGSSRGSGRAGARSDSPTKTNIQHLGGTSNAIDTGAKKRGSSIKDMIRFYDGGISPSSCFKIVRLKC